MPEGALSAVDVITLISAVVGLVTVIVKLQKVHVLVNRRMDEALNRIAQLEGALTGADVDVPPEERR